MHCRRERDWLSGRVTVTVVSGLSLTLLLSPAIGCAQDYKEYRCTPDTQYECARGHCEKMTDGFQHAESFVYNTKTGLLSACLWTNCYAAKAAVFDGAASATTGTLTAIGKLMPTAHPGNQPVIVSLTVDTGGAGEPGHRDTTDKNAGEFTAVWGYGSYGLTLDMGQCAIKKLP